MSEPVVVEMVTCSIISVNMGTAVHLKSSLAHQTQLKTILNKNTIHSV